MELVKAVELGSAFLLEILVFLARPSKLCLLSVHTARNFTSKRLRVHHVKWLPVAQSRNANVLLVPKRPLAPFHVPKDLNLTFRSKPARNVPKQPVVVFIDECCY